MSVMSENLKPMHFAVLFETEWWVIRVMPVLHEAMIWSSDTNVFLFYFYLLQ